MPKLLLKFDAAVIKEILFDKPALSVGRKPDNDIVIDNPAVSGHHCRLSLQGGAYFVEDLESTNGTYLNEKRIKKAGLHHNDMVGVAKHSLVFLEDQPAEPAKPPVPEAPPAKDGTMVMSPEQQAKALASAAASVRPEAPKAGVLRVLKGAVDRNEYELTGLSTYIGKSDRVQVPIKGSGLFGSAPEVAASIHRKADGFVLVAVEDRYPKVNGRAVSGSVLLQEGDIIDCGATTMQFGLKESASY
jgi:pSer/pThr/pTyr-binding forkhead associated (FHA) protein